jgi:hypothetical protein
LAGRAKLRPLKTEKPELSTNKKAEQKEQEKADKKEKEQQEKGTKKQAGQSFACL